MTELFLRLGARVICIEPNPNCVETLKKKFGRKQNVMILQKGLSDKEGKLTFFICEERPTISTFSLEFKSWRYHRYSWNKKIAVPVTTLDSLIEKYGTPAFCKIDVEGFEYKVLRGLNSGIHFLMFEFGRETLRNTMLCTNRISSLGNADFNFSLYKEFTLASDNWLDSKQLFSKLESISDRYLCGNVYSRLESNLED
jgi:FkbM family methyltransferase